MSSHRSSKAYHNSEKVKQLEAKIIAAAKNRNLPIQHILFTTITDKEWGERIIALIRWLIDYVVHHCCKDCAYDGTNPVTPVQCPI